MNSPTLLKTPSPEKFSVEQGPVGLVISYRWLTSYYVFLGLFSLVWDAIAVFLSIRMYDRYGLSIMSLLPLIQVGIGVGVTYTALAGFLNKTTVMVGGGKLSIHHAPLPWPGNRSYGTHDIAQLFSEERIIRSKNGTRRRYQLHLVTRNNMKVRLIGNLYEPDTVRFLERKIEEYLRIENQPVEGEMSG